jgi:hypothetical protein
MEYLKFIFSGVWIFFGFLILLAMVLNFLGNCWIQFWKYVTSNKRKSSIRDTSDPVKFD